jgi:hypothetical protein
MGVVGRRVESVAAEDGPVVGEGGKYWERGAIAALEAEEETREAATAKEGVG